MLDLVAVDTALRNLIGNDVDYDIHKAYECNEETGEDTYDELVNAFVLYYEAAVNRHKEETV